MCHNCDDLLFKKIPQVINHVWSKHRIEVTKIELPVSRSDDARLPKEKTAHVSRYRCVECEASLKNIRALLTHLDRKHGIHIWFERGIARKRLFLDGILDENPAKEIEEKREMRKRNLSLLDENKNTKEVS